MGRRDHSIDNGRKAPGKYLLVKEPQGPRIVVLVYMESLIQGQPAMVHAGCIIQVRHAKSCCQEEY